MKTASAFASVNSLLFHGSLNQTASIYDATWGTAVFRGRPGRQFGRFRTWALLLVSDSKPRGTE
jgi:hypothetical protein